MSSTESERRVIYDRTDSLKGRETANSFMKLIPYPSAEQLATHTDIHARTTKLRAEMAELRSDQPAK